MSDTTARRTVSGWTVGLIVFAASIMIMVGAFQIIGGLAAIFDDQFFVVTQNYVFDLDVTAWGWVHLLLGILLVFAGWGIFSGATWARATGMLLAILSAISNFFFIPYYPVWAIVVIALDVAVIYALSVWDRDQARAGSY
jgi:uncharacterized membrane protein